MLDLNKQAWILVPLGTLQQNCLLGQLQVYKETGPDNHKGFSLEMFLTYLLRLSVTRMQSCPLYTSDLEVSNIHFLEVRIKIHAEFFLRGDFAEHNVI